MRRIIISICLANHTLYTGPFLSHSLVEVTVPAEEASQEAKVDATINNGRVMKRLGCDCLKKRSPHVKTLPPHVEQGLCTLRRQCYDANVI